MAPSLHVLHELHGEMLFGDAGMWSRSVGLCSSDTNSYSNRAMAFSHRSVASGGGGIRTRETCEGLPVFKTGGFVRSPTPP